MPGLDPGIHRKIAAGESPPFFVWSATVRRMGGAKRYPSIAVCEDDGFREERLGKNSIALERVEDNFLLWLVPNWSRKL